MIDFDELRQKLKGNINLVLKYIPHGQKRGNEIVAGDIYGYKKGESFSFNWKSGLWSDFASAQSGGSLFDLLIARGYDHKKAADELFAQIGVSDITPTTQETPKRTQNLSTPNATSPKTIWRDNVNIPVVAYWAYKTEDGEFLGFDCRIETIIDKNGTPEVKKEVIPLYWNGEKFKQGMLVSPRPLFNLDQIKNNPDKTVIVVEGCKTAQAGCKHYPDYVTTTWQGGTKAVKKANWEALAGRDVILIPDADDVGVKAMQEIADKLSKLNCNIRFVDVSNKPEAWDIADFTADEDPIQFLNDNLKQDVNVVVNKPKSEPTSANDFFRPIGLIGDEHYYYHKQSGQVVSFSPMGYTKQRLVSLAPLAYWQINYGGRQGVDWLCVCDDLCRVQEKIGVFDINSLRGLGAWFDAGRYVINLGETLFVDGQEIPISKFESKFIYIKKSPIALNLNLPLPSTESARLIEIFRLCRWERKEYGDILAGWVFSSIVCGALAFRSHIYMIGARGSGKSWVLENLVRPVMGRMAMALSSKTTEAGVRCALESNILPVILDEAEGETMQDKQRLQSIIDLSRQASSEHAAPIVKGRSGGGGSIAYIVRSAFLFASINSIMSKSADLSRTTFIKLKSLNKPSSEECQKDSANFKLLEKQASLYIDDDFCSALITRAIKMIPIIRQTAQTIAEICAKNYGSRRLGDTMGMPIAGIWCLQNDHAPTQEQADELITRIAIFDEKAEDEDQTQEENALDCLLFSEIMLPGNKRCILSAALSAISGVENPAEINRIEATDYLAAQGFVIKDRCLYISTKSEALPSTLFKDTEWGKTGWKESLLRIAGATRSNNMYFSKAHSSRAVCIPLEVFMNDDFLL